MVPTLDLMQQWYALLQAAFPDNEIGLIGGGYHEPRPLTIATYDSAARHIERLGAVKQQDPQRAMALSRTLIKEP